MDRGLYAAVTGTCDDVEALRKLIDRGVHEILPEEERGSAPLQTATFNASLDVLHQVTPGKNTSLHLAARNGHLRIVKALLQRMNDDIEAGQEENHQFLVAQNLQGNTALHEAAKEGHFQVVNVLLEQSSHHDLADIVNEAGETALFKAAEEGHEEIVLKLVHLTYSVSDNRKSDGRTPLHAAVSHTHRGVIQILLDERPELLKKVDKFDRTPLHAAAYADKAVAIHSRVWVPLLNFLPISCLHSRCHVDKGSEIAKLLLEKDSSLCYAVDKKKRSALQTAVIEGNVELVKEMMRHAHDCLEIVDEDGRNALHLAAENAVKIFEKNSRRMKDLMHSIISKELINNLDKHGKTPLDIVLEKMNNDERIFSAMKGLLEENGARSSPKMVKEETWERSLESNKSDKAQMISVSAVLIATVAFDASLNLPNKDNQTAAFVAFVLFDAMAFCGAIATTIILIYAVYDNHEDSLLLRNSMKGLWTALIALTLAFGTAFLMSIQSQHRIVRGIVWMMALGVPIVVRDLIFRSKRYVFKEGVTYATWGFLIGGIVPVCVFMLIDNLLLVNIYVTIAFAWNLVWSIRLPMKTNPVKTIDDSILDRVSNTVWGRIAFLLVNLATVGVNWLLYFSVY